MLTRAKTRALRSLLIKLLVCAVIIAAGLIYTKCCFIDFLKGPIDLNSQTEWDTDELEGKYVTLDVNAVLFDFAEETSTNKKTNVTTTTATCFIGFFYDDSSETYRLYGIKANKSSSSHLYNIINADDLESIVPETITGTFTKMDGEMLDYYQEGIDIILSEGYDIPVINYCIYQDYIGGVDFVSAIIAYLIIIIALIYAIVSSLQFVCGHYKNYINKYIKQNPNETLEYMEADYTTAVDFSHDYKIGKKYIYFPHGSSIDIRPLSNQVWAYFYSKRSGRTVTHQIIMYDINKKQTLINVDSTIAGKILEYLDNQYSYIVVGYSKELEDQFNKDFNGFLDQKYNPAKRDEGNFSFESNY